MKKVLLIADSNMSLSGVPIVFMSIVRHLSKEYLFDIVVFKDNDMYFEKEFLSYGGKIFRYNFKKPSNILKKIIWIKLSYHRSVKKFLNDNINLKDYTAIHSFQEDFSYPFIKAAKKMGIKNRIMHICSAKSAYKTKKTLNRKLLDFYSKNALKQATHIIFVSKQALKLTNYKNKGMVLYSVLDNQKYDQIIECNHKKLELTQIGTFSSRKNQLFSLEVLKRIKQRIPDVHLNFIGKEIESGYLDKMNTYISNEKLEDNVTFLNSAVNQIDLYKHTSFILYPSTMESFGLILIEAQSCGIHCFANIDIPNDANMGNVDFIELNIDSWANSIEAYYKANNNYRKSPKNTELFSAYYFKSTLLKLYSDS